MEWLTTRVASSGVVHRTLVLYMGALVAVAVFFFFLALRHFIGAHSQTAERLEELVALEQARAEESAARSRGADFVTRLLMKLSIARGMADDLDRANLALTVPEYMLVMAAGGSLAFLVGVLRGSVVLGLLLVLVTLMVLRLWVRRRARKRLDMFAKQLNDVINLIVGALRAGYGIVQAIDVVVREMPAPASEEMSRIVREVRLGLPLAVALDRSVERIDNDDWALVVSSIKIQAEVGGNLAEILDTVAHTIRERVRVLQEIRVLTTQQRLTGWLLSIMPFALALILFIVNPEYMSGLLTPGLPMMLAGAGVLGIAVGAVVIRRIVDIEV